MDPLAVFAVVKGFGVEFARACEPELKVGQLIHDERGEHALRKHLPSGDPIACTVTQPSHRVRCRILPAWFFTKSRLLSLPFDGVRRDATQPDSCAARLTPDERSTHGSHSTRLSLDLDLDACTTFRRGGVRDVQGGSRGVNVPGQRGADGEALARRLRPSRPRTAGPRRGGGCGARRRREGEARGCGVGGREVGGPGFGC